MYDIPRNVFRRVMLQVCQRSVHFCGEPCSHVTLVATQDTHCQRSMRRWNLYDQFRPCRGGRITQK